MPIVPVKFLQLRLCGDCRNSRLGQQCARVGMLPTFGQLPKNPRGWQSLRRLPHSLPRPRSHSSMFPTNLPALTNSAHLELVRDRGGSCSELASRGSCRASARVRGYDHCRHSMFEVGRLVGSESGRPALGGVGAPEPTNWARERRQAPARSSKPKARHRRLSAQTSPALRLSMKRSLSSGLTAEAAAPATCPCARCSEAIKVSTSPPASRRPSVQMVRWRGLPSSLRNDSTNCA
jgi:hypothetical protein